MYQKYQKVPNKYPINTKKIIKFFVVPFDEHHFCIGAWCLSNKNVSFRIGPSGTGTVTGGAQAKSLSMFISKKNVEWVDQPVS